eukprot:COSAG01_NODE_48834_length_377_cov_1.402878_1_plen_28_part_01
MLLEMLVPGGGADIASLRSIGSFQSIYS